MKIWGLTKEELTQALLEADRQYGHNVRFKRFPTKDGRAYRLTITVFDSHRPGSRRSFNSEGGIRRVAAACWHAHRDFMRMVFRANPDARIQTMLADYRGSENFEAFFPVTAATNVGSQAQPLAIGEACNCAGCIAEQLQEKVH